MPQEGNHSRSPPGGADVSPLSLPGALGSPDEGSVVWVVVVVVDDVAVVAVVVELVSVVVDGLTGGVTDGVTGGVTGLVVVFDVVGVTGGVTTGLVSELVAVTGVVVVSGEDALLPQALVKSIPARRLAPNVDLNNRMFFITPRDVCGSAGADRRTSDETAVPSEQYIEPRPRDGEPGLPRATRLLALRAHWVVWRWLVSKRRRPSCVSG